MRVRMFGKLRQDLARLCTRTSLSSVGLFCNPYLQASLRLGFSLCTFLKGATLGGIALDHIYQSELPSWCVQVQC